MNLCQHFLACFAGSANKFDFYLQCTYIVLILHCLKVQSNHQILLKRAEDTNIVLIVFKPVLYHDYSYTVTISYCHST